jgi:hypothetical protein
LVFGTQRRDAEVIRRLLALLILCSAALATTAACARADFAGGGGGLGSSGGLKTDISYDTPGGATGAHTPAGQRSLITYVWVVYKADPSGEGDTSGVCDASSDPATDVLGNYFRKILTALDGEILVDVVVCEPLVNGQSVPPPVPAPPTVEEAWKSAQIPPPDVQTDPAKRGITGLPTRIWTTAATQFSIHVDLRGYRVTGTATLDYYEISVDGGAPVRATNDEFTFETKGNHRIVVTAVWHGHATLSGNDIDPPIDLGDIGTATISSTRTYPVHEIRSVLTP